MLYGDGDFKKSMLIALNCGDDTDCTAGTIGSIMGLIYGTKGIPEDWREYIGDDIVTGTINPCISLPLPKNCKELTEKVVSLAPAVLHFNQVNGNYVGFGDKTEISEDEKNKFYLPYGEAEETDLMRASLLSLKENVITKKIAYMTVVVSYDDDADIYLFCNLPVGEMHNIDKPFGKQYDDRDLPAFVEKARTLYGQGKAVAIADIAYSNGGDVKFAKMLSKEIGLFNLAGYAGWNTSSNTLGTVICQSVFYNFYGDTPAHRAFTAERACEDLGYCA